MLNKAFICIVMLAVVFGCTNQQEDTAEELTEQTQETEATEQAQQPEEAAEQAQQPEATEQTEEAEVAVAVEEISLTVSGMT